MPARREFLTSALVALTGVTIAPGLTSGLASGLTSGVASGVASGIASGRKATSYALPAGTGQQSLTIRQLIDSLLAEIPGGPFKGTVDTVKAGNPDQPVKGIVTTMFATDAIIEKAHTLGANFIIAHEPTFYNHADDTNWLHGDPVYGFKKELLEKYGIVVWRFHDGIHSLLPDGVRMGVMQALGWEKYYDDMQRERVVLPNAIPLSDLIARLKKNLGIDHLKYIGDLAQPCQTLVLSPGAAGGRRHIEAIFKYHPDVFICGELNEWETSEYIRDARYQGKKISLIVLGHSLSEEPGLQWLIPVVQKKAPGIPVSHIPSGDAFAWA